MNDETFIRQRFDARAAHYDNPLTAFIGEHELRAVRALIPPGRQVLDYGCGTGRTTLDLLRRGCRVTAYDLAPAMLTIGRDRAAVMGYGGEWISARDALAGRQWPYVACIGVLDYYPNPNPLLQDLASFLGQDGTLVVTVPNAWSPLAWLYAFGSRFTVPARPQTFGWLRACAQQAGLQLYTSCYAFPGIRPLGMTLVAALVHIPHVQETKPK